MGEPLVTEDTREDIQLWLEKYIEGRTDADPQAVAHYVSGCPIFLSYEGKHEFLWPFLTLRYLDHCAVGKSKGGRRVHRGAEGFFRRRTGGREGDFCETQGRFALKDKKMM